MRRPVNRVRIPTRFVDGIWESAWGGPLPIENHTDAVIVVPRDSIADNGFLELMRRRARHWVLDEGTPLLVAVTIRPEREIPKELRALLRPYRQFPNEIAGEFLDYWSSGELAFVMVHLAGPDPKQTRLFGTDRGGLWLITQGAEAVGLASTTITLPHAISRETVTSLNQAYTRLSEAFEPWRISHTGNIYRHVLYKESDGRWYPLDVLRNVALDKQDKAIASELWARFMAKMARPPIPSGGRDR